MTTARRGRRTATPTMPVARALGQRRIVVTRPVGRADTLCDLLTSRGAVPIRMPLLRVVPPASWHDLDDALRCLGEYDWIVFTSVNGVQAVLDRLSRLDLGAEELRAVRVAAVGPATRDELRAAGITAEAVPSEYLGERIAAALGPIAGQRILLPRAEVATSALPHILAESDAEVHEVTAYRTLPMKADPTVAQVVRSGVDAITFTSPSAVRSFAAGFGGTGLSILSDSAVATIGPTTSATARDLDVLVHVEATEHTMDGLVEALERHFAAQTGEHGAREAGDGM